MDYDDSDFQNQTFQLVGEDINKFPQSLRSLPLPKFDLDEHLQVHLRFDSSVETEILLGMQSQGNNWIEDFTEPVGSEIKFGSTAAESCLIYRPENVWSEATSSESVEMLLKSVGEDEMIDQKVIIKQADVDDGSNDMDSQTNTCLRQNDTNSKSKTVDIIHTDPLHPLDICQKSLSVICEDVKMDQFQVPDSPESSKNEKSGTERDISAVSDSFNSEASIIARQCIMDRTFTLSPNYATKSSSSTKQPTYETVQKGNPSYIADTKKGATDYPIERVVTSEVSDFVIARSSEGDLSSVSTGNLIVFPGKMHTQMLSEQVMEEDSEIDIIDKSGLLTDAAQNGRSQIRDSKVNDQSSQVSAVRTNLSSTETSSFLEPSVKSLMLSNEGCSEHEFPENPRDTTALNKENQAIEFALSAEETYSSVMEGDEHIGKTYVGIIDKDSTNMSCLTEGSKSSGYSEPVCLSKDDASHVESTLSIENINIVSNYEVTELNSSVEVIEGKRDPIFELTDKNNDDEGDTYKFTVNVDPSNGVSYEMAGKSKQDDDTLGFNSLTSQHNSTVIAKHTDDEIMEYIVKDDPKDDISEECPSPALQDDAEKVLSSFHGKSYDKCDKGGLVAETYNVTSLPEIASFVKDKTEGFNSLTSKHNSTVITQHADNEMIEYVVKDDPQDDRSEECPSPALLDDAEKVLSSFDGKSFDTDNGGGLVAGTYTVSTFPPELASFVKETSVEFDSVTSQHNSTGIARHADDDNFEYIGKDAPKYERPEESSSPALLDDAYNTEGLTSLISQHNLVVIGKHADDEHIEYVVKDALKDDKSEELSSPELASFVKENTAPTMSSGSTSSKNDNSIVVDKKEDASCIGQETAISSVTDCPSPRKLIQDKSAVFAPVSVDTSLHPLNNSVDVNQSQPEGTLPMDAVMEQKGATATQLPASDIIQLDQKEVEIPENIISKGNIDFHQSQSEGTLPMDVVMEQKGATATELSASDIIQLDQKEMEIPGNIISKGNIDAQISRELGDPVVIDGSSVKDIYQDEPVADLESVAVKLVSIENSMNFHRSYSKDTMLVDIGVKKKEEETSGSTLSPFINSNEKEIKVSDVSISSVSKDIASSQLSRGLTALSNSAADILVGSSTELQCIDVILSSSVEVSDVGLHNELQPSIVTHERALELGGNLVAHASSLNGTVDSDSSGAFSQEETTLIISVESSSHCERQTMLIEKPSSGDIQNKQQNCVPNIGPDDNCPGQNDIAQTDGDALNHCTNNSPISENLTRSNDDSLMLKSGSANPRSSEQDCGSPTVISCSGHLQEGVDQEGNEGRPEPADPTLDDLPFRSFEAKAKGDQVKCSHDSKESTSSEEDRSFTFKVGSLADLSARGTGNKWKPFSSVQSFVPPQFNSKSKEGFEESYLESEKDLHRTISKAPGDDNTRHVSGCLAIERIVSSPRKVPEETPSPKQSDERDRNQCSTPKSVGIANRNMQLQEMEHCAFTESSLKQSCCPVPDLNTSVSAVALFHQPFTDLQQVQLRAQIFVYGSLMQGIPPDEACMTSAFGEADGGRSLWDRVWRVSAERYQIQKSPFSSYETLSHSHSGIRVSEQVTICSSLQSKASGPPSQNSSKAVPSALVNSTLPLPSPLWSVSTRDGLHSNMPRVAHLDFNEALSPSHHSSQIRQYTGNSTPLLSQSPRPGPWAVSSYNSTYDVSSPYPTLSVTETVQVTPARDTSVPLSHNFQVSPLTALLTTPGPTSVSAASIWQIDSQRKVPTPGNNKSPSTVQKSRKRKKGSAVHEELQPNILGSQLPSDRASNTGVANNSPALTSSGLAISANSVSKVAPGAIVSAKSPIISHTHYLIAGHGDIEQRAIFSGETGSKIEQTKLQAEDASALAASAVRHGEGIWSQLTTQKNSGLVSEVDEKLASAAVAIAAAACVAKAAAAAAKLASDAALQAKLMADEALNSVRTGTLSRISETGPHDMGKSLTMLTPGSILTGKNNVSGSSSIIYAAREAARRRVEAASAATKRAENLDAIVRAAELAAEAVSQAGAIIAMGEPLPFTLSELVEAGPEGRWEVHQFTTDKLAKANNLHQHENTHLDGAKDCDRSVKKLNKQPPNNESRQKTTNEDGTVSCNQYPVQSEKDYKGNASTFPTDGHEKDHSTSNDKENIIQKGCLVEVIVDEDGLRGAWFSAHVLDVKNGKAYISYNNPTSDEGMGRLNEWISLEGEGDKASRIRLAHPTTAAKFEGTRKRRREAIGNYVWAIGDRVDAWIRDGWWEGVVTEKSQGDDTKLTVHFPDGGDSSTVRAWNLRPSLIWKDGHWIEWSRARENASQPYESDTPREKRQKLGRPEANIDPEDNGKGIRKLSKNLPAEDSRKLEESRPLILSAKERTFSVGKNAREDNNCDALKVRRTDLQKEGSRVVFGVPKPGKKRKFMEVSKHYIEDRTDKTSGGNDSIKFAKFLMPQASSIWRNTSKVDPKGKGASDSKSKGIKSVKSRTMQTRSKAEKDNSSITASNGGNSRHGSLPNGRAAQNKKNRLEVGSYNNLETMNNPDVEPSGQSVPIAHSSKKSSPAVEADIEVKGKVTPAVVKSTRSGDGSEDTGKMMSDAPEPRRSNRRIQPTSRLLEGLQSSLTITKIPSFSHDKGTKAHHRGASSRGNAHD